MSAECFDVVDQLAAMLEADGDPRPIGALRAAVLADLIRRMDIPVRAVLREKGTPYAELGLSDPALTDDQLLDAMMAHPVLINRPFVFTELGVRLCRPSELVLDILPHPQRGAFSKEDGEAVVDAAGQCVTGVPA